MATHLTSSDYGPNIPGLGFIKRRGYGFSYQGLCQWSYGVRKSSRGQNTEYQKDKWASGIEGEGMDKSVLIIMGVSERGRRSWEETQNKFIFQNCTLNCPDVSLQAAKFKLVSCQALDS